MSKLPKVGIVIPSYERLLYLKKCLKSVFNQTYKKLEVIIIDDCSPDLAIKKYLKKINHSKVKCFFNKKNLGGVKIYQKGPSLLSKEVEWCLILDNDDFLEKNFIEEAVKTHLKYPQAKVIHGRQIFIDADEKIINGDKEFPLKENAEDYLILRCVGQREIRSSSIFFNLKQYKKIGGFPLFPSGMGTDPVFIFSLAFDNMLAFSTKALVYTRIHEGAESQTVENLLPKLLSLKQMKDYCLKVYKKSSRVKQKKRKRVLNYLNYYINYLISALLIRKYKDLVAKKSTLVAKKSLKKIINLCNKNKITIPLRFLLLSRFFNNFSINLEKLWPYNFFLDYSKKLRFLEKSIRHFLADRNFYIKKYSEKFPPLAYLSKQLNFILIASEKSFLIIGFKYCHCCGYYSFFYWNKNYEDLLQKAVSKWRVGRNYGEQIVKRENEFCAHCKSNFRTRAQAKTILQLLKLSRISDLISFLKTKPSFKVYETANYWVFRDEKIKKIKNYFVSEFHSEHPFGKKINKIRNESLEKLTFRNKSIDLLITSAVLEHVVDLDKALSEIYRVLKPGGYHIFTIPVDYSRKKTRSRISLPSIFHGDGLGEILCLRDFGTDIDKIMEKHGFSCKEEKYYLKGEHITSVYISQKI